MRTSRFSETQIVAILKEADAGMNLCRKRGYRYRDQMLF